MAFVSEKPHLLDSEEFEQRLNMSMAREISELVVEAEGEERTTWFVWLLVCCCSISGLLFGKALRMMGLLLD